jgi:hypothetical protein
MINDSGLVPTNFADVTDKFSQLVKKFAVKETEWLVQKGNYENKISDLEGQLKAHENINVDLLKRIRMLEYALTQERLKKSPQEGQDDIKLNNNTTNINQNTHIMNDIPDNRQLLREGDLKAIREKSIRPSLIS